MNDYLVTLPVVREIVADGRGEVETYYLECGGGGGDTKLVWDDIVRINELTGRVIAEKKEKGGKS